MATAIRTVAVLRLADWPCAGAALSARSGIIDESAAECEAISDDIPPGNSESSI